MQMVSGLERSLIEAHVRTRSTFQVVGLRGSFMEAIKFIEKTIESSGLRCRVETDIKSSMAASGVAGAGAVLAAASTPVIVTAGVLSFAAGIGHKVITRNPDYLISKDYVNFKLTVTYKK